MIRMEDKKTEYLKKLSDTLPVSEYNTEGELLGTAVLSLDYGPGEVKHVYGMIEKPEVKSLERSFAATRGVVIGGKLKSTYIRSDSTMRKPEFIEALTNVLNLYYKNVELQIIKPLGDIDITLPSITRIPVSIAYFLHGEDQELLGRVFIKDYEDNERCKRKDLIIPQFLSDLGIPVASLLGYNLREEEYPHRYAILKEPSFKNKVLSHEAGNENYSHLLKILNNEHILKTASAIVRLMAEMQVKATAHLDDLEHKYGLELEDTDHDLLIEDRFLQHLGVGDERLVKDFKNAYSVLKKIEGEKNLYFVQGDFTPNNVRRGSTIFEYFILDYELARKRAFSADDLAMFASCVARARPHSLKWEEVQSRLQNDYLSKFNEMSKLSGMDMRLASKVMNMEMMIETLRAHLYKIGDQIWTQDKGGKTEERKSKAIYHFEQYLAVSNRAKEIFSGSRAKIVDELEKKVVALVKASPKLAYLKPITT